MHSRQNMTDIAAAAVLLAARHTGYDHDEIAITAVQGFEHQRTTGGSTGTDGIVAAASAILTRMEVRLNVAAIVGTAAQHPLKWDEPLDAAHGVDDAARTSIRSGMRTLLTERFKLTLAALKDKPVTITRKSTVTRIVADVLSHLGQPSLA